MGALSVFIKSVVIFPLYLFNPVLLLGVFILFLGHPVLVGDSGVLGRFVVFCCYRLLLGD